MTMPSIPTIKICPKCGHRSRAGAKNCAQCGTGFFIVYINGELRKRCRECNFYNRDRAKVCTHCGAPYPAILITSRGNTQKWCTQCGAPRRSTAKVCTQCGFRFTQSPLESPIQQSPALANPLSQQIQAAPPPSGAARPAYDLSGEPAPYISPQEMTRLLHKGTTRKGFMMRLLRALWGENK